MAMQLNVIFELSTINLIVAYLIIILLTLILVCKIIDAVRTPQSIRLQITMNSCSPKLFLPLPGI